ncbi:putative metalloreductase [Phaeomoniella chlamydospora]|uniref:ferric-chelate reductase (NADPH) n=1 Tax=Phaeomoniella chlamydospora TaxID=158046 RepID=A0A0G2FVQ3_PHACM|nr:putative metalloreductase [Phaeomoniella chlamydospora]
MVLLVALAGRNNPLIPLLKVNFDTFNLLHRWIGRIVILEAIAHTCAWAVNAFAARGSNNAMEGVLKDQFLFWGAVGTVAMMIIAIQSSSPLRHAFYETFIHLHQFLAFMTILGVYVHLEVSNLPALPYIRTAVGLWAGDRFLRVARLIYLNVSRRKGCTTVSVKALQGEACRVTFHLPRRVIIKPGSHVYIYVPRISGWMSHPFSVAWTDTDSEPYTGQRSSSPAIPESPGSIEKFQNSTREESTSTSVSLIIQARTGFTRKIYEKACIAPNNTLNLTGLVEGPYSGHDSLSSYGTVLLFAGGAGITHHLVQIRHLIACASAGTVATRRIVLVWSVKTVDQLAWVQPWMDEILSMEGRREMLRIRLFVTKPRNPNEIRSPSTTVQMMAGRCQPGVVMDAELPSRIGATAVSVCGPGAFTDEVRHAVRERLHIGSLDFLEEAFTW